MFLRSLSLSRLPRRFSLNNFAITLKDSPKTRRRSTSWLKRNLLLIVVGTVEARDTSRDMDNVQMIGTKITAIKEYLYVRHPHCTSFITSAHLVKSTSTMSSSNIFNWYKYCKIKLWFCPCFIFDRSSRLEFTKE